MMVHAGAPCTSRRQGRQPHGSRVDATTSFLFQSAVKTKPHTADTNLCVVLGVSHQLPPICCCVHDTRALCGAHQVAVARPPAVHCCTQLPAACLGDLHACATAQSEGSAHQWHARQCTSACEHHMHVQCSRMSLKFSFQQTLEPLAFLVGAEQDKPLNRTREKLAPVIDTSCARTGSSMS